ncbi:GCN5-related N-acetyltransferase [Desulfovibrio sp. X2]|uniref:N-acetyltransferase n=1 Tax=Desulfovibrio sp. X2 TaxID=941449 RepID=UPI000358BEB5|nr:N-acetyltransferase [Desulfovibrio sp. X2]EPR37570.1 GCN5-related N-acetyltransferase [Desulfovibrio sp. X2]
MSVTVRKARMADVKYIHKLLYGCAQRGQLLARSYSSVYAALRDFYVAENENGELLGCCALSICWEDLAEIRSLAVAEAHRGHGIGRALVTACLDEARELGLRRVFALTYEVAFFTRLGYRQVEKNDLPQKVWTDCLNCPKFPDCDETAMLIETGVEAPQPAEAGA